MIPKLSESCCCTLQKGVKIFSWLQLVYSLLATFILSPIIIIFTRTEGRSHHVYREYDTENQSRIIRGYDRHHIDDIMFWNMLGFCLIVALIGNFISSILLVCGIYKGKHKFMIPYIIYSSLRVHLYCVLTLFLVLLCIKDLIFMAVVSLLVPLNCFEIYSWLIVYSFFHELRNQRKRQRQNIASAVSVV